GPGTSWRWHLRARQTYRKRTRQRRKKANGCHFGSMIDRSPSSWDRATQSRMQDGPGAGWEERPMPESGQATRFGRIYAPDDAWIAKATSERILDTDLPI